MSDHPVMEDLKTCMMKLQADKQATAPYRRLVEDLGKGIPPCLD